MCGILGIVGGPSLTVGMLEDSLSSMKARGPDGEGVFAHSKAGSSFFDKPAKVGGQWLERGPGRVILGHRRLSIVGGASGVQPLVSKAPRGLLASSVNGEFYEHKKWRGYFADTGRRLETDSDSELASRMYSMFGLDGFDRLRGEFAFLLFDEVRGSVFAARDRFGSRPLHWARFGDGFVLGSTAKSLFPFIGRPVADQTALSWAMALQYLPPTKTMFSGVFQIPPGFVAEFRQGEPEPLFHKIGWRRFFPSETGDPIRDAVIQRLPDGLPVCAHLSGGFDSSLVCSMGAAQRPDLCAVSVSFFEDPASDEGPKAAAVADGIGISKKELKVSAADMFETLPFAVEESEGLAINGHLAAKFLLQSFVASEGFRVCLTGEGSDELFFGYEHLLLDMGIGGGSGRLAGVHTPSGPVPDLSVFLDAWGFVPSWVRTKAGAGLRLGALMRAGAFEGMYKSAAAGMVSAFPEAGEQSVPEVERSAGLWIGTALSGYILKTLDDAPGGAFGVESRQPFLDPEVAALARSLTPEQKVFEGRDKAFLRQAYFGEMPGLAAWEPKSPFMAPSLAVAAGRDKGLARKARASFESAAEGFGFFDKDSLMSWFDKALESGSPGTETVFTTVMTLGLWAQAFGGGSDA